MTHNLEKLIRSLHSRHGRKKHKLCLCEGVRACGELLAHRPDLVKHAVKTDDCVLPAEFDAVDFITVPQEKMKQLSPTVTPQGVLFTVKRPETEYQEQFESPYALVLDGVSDPGNMGTIIRTARAAGLSEIFLTSGCADPFSDKVIRSALASQFALQIFRFANLGEAVRELRGAGCKNFWKTDPHGGVPLFEEPELFTDAAIIIGGEASGVSAHPECRPVTIPMPGKSESLNAAQAATIFMFEAVRRKT